MDEIYQRTAMLLGENALKILANKKVAIFGIGGVGGYVCEGLARGGVGALDLIDHDKVSTPNINRQIIALNSTVGMYKTEAAQKRILDINPEIKITEHRVFYTPETAIRFDFSDYDYIVDAIDTVTGKIELAVKANEHNVPIISSMGTGNKLDPTKFEVSDIYKTSVCPLARVMRRELKKRDIKKLKVVHSKEEPIVPGISQPDEVRRAVPGSVSFVPSVAGLIIAGEVIKDLIKNG